MKLFAITSQPFSTNRILFVLAIGLGAINHGITLASETTKVVMMSASQANEENILKWKKEGYDIALEINSVDQSILSGIERIKKHAGSVDYFFEVGRCPQLAASHPEWMASIQGHHEWRRMFPDTPKPDKGEVIKVSPWVPIFNREPFDAHVARIKSMLVKLPKPKRIWLNDIQGAPSACGCGHPLCRWTTDYGPLKTATPIGDSAPAEFLAEIKKLANGSKVIPIMTSECEEADQHTVCGGVGCFKGICWKAFTRQLDQAAKQAPEIGVACFYKAFDRDLPRYREKAGWIRYAVESFEKMPKIRNGTGVKTNRLIAVLQGWDVTPEELNQQIVVAQKIKTAGTLICLAKVDQDWKPKKFRIPRAGK